MSRAQLEGLSETYRGPWAARMIHGDPREARALCGHVSLEAAMEAGVLWLRAGALEPELDRDLRSISGLERFRVVDGGGLVPMQTAGCRVPVALLPTLDWNSISELLPVRADPAALACETVPSTELRLEPCAKWQPPRALLVDFSMLVEWGEGVSSVRFGPLCFAVDSGGRAVVKGEPLPSLRGRTFWECERLLIPSGYGFAPVLDSSTLRQVVGRGQPKDAWILCELDGLNLLKSEVWQPMSRSALRETRSSLENSR